MRLKNKKVLVYGLGSSGRSAIKLLEAHKANVSFYDDDLRCFEYVGFERNPQDKQYDFVVISPGIKCLGNKLVEHFVETKTPIISELDLAFQFCKGKILAITGTNGKTTTAMLTAKILKEAGVKNFLCGNIGLPFSAVCEQVKKDDVVVCEVSNFQLETSVWFCPDVACVLNVKPDHLDRHKTFEEYLRVKSKIAQKMSKNRPIWLNFDDNVARSMFWDRKCNYFSKKALKRGVFASNGQIFANKRAVLDIEKISLKGEKNLENVLAAIALVCQFKIKKEVVEKAVSSFVPADHRMKVLGELEGVVYVDDSKATNVSSAVAAVQTFKDKPILLLLGGRSKECDYSPIFEDVSCLKKVVCFGEDGNNIFQVATKFDCDCCLFEKFEDAVLFCVQTAQKGEVVLLSPACSSFDQFSSYAERGDCFANLILGATDGQN